MSNVDINVDRRTDGQTDGRTENRMPISHPATSRCDKNDFSLDTVRNKCYFWAKYLQLSHSIQAPKFPGPSCSKRR